MYNFGENLQWILFLPSFESGAPRPVSESWFNRLGCGDSYRLQVGGVLEQDGSVILSCLRCKQQRIYKPHAWPAPL
jgi:hypothetical protein